MICSTHIELQLDLMICSTHIELQLDLMICIHTHRVAAGFDDNKYVPFSNVISCRQDYNIKSDLHRLHEDLCQP